MVRRVTLPTWQDCERCERHARRLGVCAKVWPKGTRIAVIGLAASRGAQASESEDPHLLRCAEAVCDGLGLAPTKVVTDVIVACGLGEPSVDDAATCGQRFVDNDSASLQLVVLVGRQVAGMARAAGLNRGGQWQPLGRAAVPTVVWEPEEGLLELVNRVRRALGLSPVLAPSRQALEHLARTLRGVIKGHGGHGIQRRGVWSRSPGALTVAQVRGHLRAEVAVQAYHPVGEWPYAVLDIDRHGALQEREFEKTLDWVRKQFKHSLIVTSSATGGVHAYVRLPPNTKYEHAATWLRLFVTAKGKRWFRTGPVQAELIEVPRHPVRLPFGPGSSIKGSTAPLDVQLQQFVTFAGNPDYSDYKRAKAAAVRLAGIPEKWSNSHRARISRFMAQAELGAARAGRLDPADPWLQVLQMLPPELQVVAANGVPALGTRTRWTEALVRALVDLVPRHQVVTMMSHWVAHRPHVSEDIDARPLVVAEQVLEIIDQRYGQLHGVPTATWEVIRTKLRNTLRAVYANRRDRTSLSAATGLWHRVRRPKPYSLGEIERTAFFVVRGFFDQGTRVRSVWGDELEQFTGSNTASDVGNILSGGTWLRFNARHVPGDHAAMYELDAAFWPAVPGEPVHFCAP